MSAPYYSVYIISSVVWALLGLLENRGSMSWMDQLHGFWKDVKLFSHFSTNMEIRIYLRV